MYARQLLSCKESFVPSAVAVASIFSADIVLQRLITRESKGIEIIYVCLWIVLSINTKPKRVTRKVALFRVDCVYERKSGSLAASVGCLGLPEGLVGTG